MKKIILSTVALIFTLFVHAQIIYVTTGGSGLKDGSSWANALDGNSPSGNGFTKLAQATQTATSGKQFWVAEGTYKACTDNDREKSFGLAQEVNLIGGFLGNESNVSQRNVAIHLTVFSGNIGNLNDSTDNTKIILKTAQVPWSNYSYINDIHFLNSYNNQINSIGTAIYNTGMLVVKSCIFKNNYTAGNGAGIYNISTIKVEKCIFSNNSASSGGGIYNHYASGNGPIPATLIISSKFSNNSSTAGGGGIRNCGDLTLINSLIVNNSSTAYSNGGGIYAMSNNGFMSVNTKIYNSTVANNSKQNIVIWSGKATILNSIIWGNTFSLQNNPITDIRYSTIQGYAENPLVNNSDPLFINPTAGSGTGYNGLDGNWSLRWCSPCLNTGNNSLISEGILTDMNDNPRIRYTTVDMGAYEQDNTGIISNMIGLTNNRIFISDSNIYNGIGSSWATSLAGNVESCKYPGQTLLYEAMKDATIGTEIWIKKGTYKSGLTGNRAHSFTVGNGVKVYGGFEGTETSKDQRSTKNNTTIFSGNIGDLLVDTDNSYHVFNINSQGINYTDISILDQVVISSGYADGSTLESQGGGVIVGSGTKLKISNSTIQSNTSKGNGGGVFICALSKIVIDNCSIIDNSQIVTYNFPGMGSSAAGCGIFSQGNLNLRNSQIRNNSNSTEGFGVYNTDSLTIINCKIESNPTISYYAKAGGISNSGYCSIKRTTVTNHTVKMKAGGIWNKVKSTMVIDSSEVSNNIANNVDNAVGGGILNDGKITITNSSINQNSCMLDGGGINNSVNSQCFLSNCVIAYNNAAGGWSASGGGGVYNEGILEINRCKVCNNSTAWIGGGIYNPTIVKNCIVVNNTNIGIWNGPGFQGVFNSTVMNNSGLGISSSSYDGWGRIIIHPDTFLVKNSIVYGNDGQLSGNFNVSNSCIGGVFLNEKNIFSNPYCVNATLGKGTGFNGLDANWSLQPYSPCINKGDNTFLFTDDKLDVAGNARMMFNTVDIGAFESQTAPSEVNDSSGFVTWEIFKPKLSNIQDAIVVPWKTLKLYKLDIASFEDSNTQSRIRGYICPKNTGYFKFYIASNEGDFYLSSDSNECNVKLICSNKTTNFNWETCQHTIDSIYLENNKTYYFETFCSNTKATGDYKIGWKMPNSSQIEVINGNYLMPAHQKQASGVDWEIFKNKTTYNFSTLKNTNDVPDEIVKLNSINTPDHSTFLDHFASRIKGYINPPVSGNYSFYFACDNTGQFWLSPDSSSVNAQLKSEIFSAQTDWNKNVSSQTLLAGKKYFFEILHYDTVYTDVIKLGWKIPSDTIPIVLSNPFITSCNDAVPLNDFSLFQDILAYPNWTITPRYQLKPWNATNKSIKWISSDESIATVSTEGIIKTLKAGNCQIIACAAEDSTITDTMKLTVTDYCGPFFVKPNGKGQGKSWDDAINLADLLDILNGGPMIPKMNIYVTEGIYKPTTTIDRNKTFLVSNIRLVGGFAATSLGVDTTRRDIDNHETILSGDIGEQEESIDNSYHVITLINSSVIDGLTIRDGRASCSTYGSTNALKYDDNGGGVYIPGVKSNVMITNCRITKNSAWNSGAGISCYRSSTNINESSVLTVKNSLIYDNVIQQTLFSTGGMFHIQINGHGAGISIYTSTLYTNNCIFFNNSSGFGYGKAIYVENGAANIENCSFYNNIGNYDDLRANSGAIINMNNSTLIGSLVSFFLSSANIKNSTIIGGGNISGKGNHVTLDNSIWTGMSLSNVTDGSIVDVKYSILTNNLYGTDKNNILSDSIPNYSFWLDTLANNGGFTPTAKLKDLPDNPAKSNGNPLYLGTKDQRGVVRSVSVSIGAYQWDKSTDVEKIEGSKSFKVYPNPVTNELNIEISNNTKRIDFNIVNSTGQVVFRGHLIDKTKVQTSQLAPGFYLLKFENGNALESKKFIKE